MKLPHCNSILAVVAAVTQLAGSPAAVAGPNVFEARSGISVLALTTVTPNTVPREYLPHAELTSLDFARRLERQGVQVVRLPTNPLPLMQSDMEPRGKAIDQVLEVADVFLRAGIAVIVDLHFWPPGGDAARAKVFNDTAQLESYKAAVRELAIHMLRIPHPGIALELFNEPPACSSSSGMNWKQVQPSVISDVRNHAPALPLVVTGCGGQLGGLLDLDGVDFRDQNIIYSFHFYEPFAYTHQSAFYGSAGYRIPYPPDPKVKLTDVLPSYDSVHPERFRYANNDFKRYLVSGFSERDVFRRLSQVAAWADSKRVPRNRIFMGEWGAVIGAAPLGEAARASELRWLGDVRRAAVSLGFKDAFWLFPRQGGYDYDPDNHWLRDDVAQAIGLTSPR